MQIGGSAALVGQNDTLDFLAGERRERAILRHMVFSLTMGLAFGALGEALASGPASLHGAIDPYAYLLLVAVVGRTAAGFGWALLGSALAALGPVIAMLAATALMPEAHLLRLDGDGLTLNFVFLSLAAFGTLAHFAGYEGLRGDLATGLPAGFMAIQAIRALQDGTWTVFTAAILVAVVLLCMRGGVGRVRAAVVALALGAAHFVYAAGG
ncbi:hypothetical protein Pta02_07310 [Planobispora takensis]|uniref:Uncharacterized protein n=1 Tax=Planobispora takensis TaxID=1367882 RepID=A0A8J3SR28_9ACTN|nr:hypothetical protein Pta02_07310 [Planobispora takensis]